MTEILIRERRERFDTNRDEDHVKEAEIAVIWPQAGNIRSHQKPEEAGRDSALEPLEGA